MLIIDSKCTEKKKTENNIEVKQRELSSTQFKGLTVRFYVLDRGIVVICTKLSLSSGHVDNSMSAQPTMDNFPVKLGRKRAGYVFIWDVYVVR